MPLAAHRPKTPLRASLAVVAVAIAAAPRVAAADPPADLPPAGTPAPSPARAAAPAPAPSPSPPTDLPPVAGMPAPVPVPGAAPAPAPPTTPVTPPVLPNYAQLPPGYAPPFMWSAPPVRPPVTNVELPPLPPRRYNSPGLFAGGVTAVSVGTAVVLLGSYFVASAPGRIEIYCDTPSFPCAYKTDAQRLTAGALMMTAGTLVAVAGIPMWFIGARQVVDEKKAAALPVDVRVGAGTASVSVPF